MAAEVVDLSESVDIFFAALVVLSEITDLLVFAVEVEVLSRVVVLFAVGDVVSFVVVDLLVLAGVVFVRGTSTVGSASQVKSLISAPVVVSEAVVAVSSKVVVLR